MREADEVKPINPDPFLRTVNEIDKERLSEFLKASERPVIVGLGNVWRSDDGVGVAALRKLKELGAGDKAGLVEAERNLLNFIPEIADKNPTRLLIIDAANLEAEPGTLATFTGEELVERCVSTHENNLPMALTYLKKMAPECAVLFLGIQFEHMEMSEELELTAGGKKGAEAAAKVVAGILDG